MTRGCQEALAQLRAPLAIQPHGISEIAFDAAMIGLNLLESGVKIFRTNMSNVDQHVEASRWEPIA